jgi:hypothetical protein
MWRSLPEIETQFDDTNQRDKILAAIPKLARKAGVRRTQKLVRRVTSD